MPAGGVAAAGVGVDALDENSETDSREGAWKYAAST